MSTNQMRIAFTAGFFLCIFIFGYWLSRSGKPYNQVLFTAHKLIALGLLIYLAVTVYGVHRVTPFTPGQVLLLVLTGVCFLALFISGALVSLDKVMPVIVLRLHQVSPYLALLSTSVSLYLFWVSLSPR